MHARSAPGLLASLLVAGALALSASGCGSSGTAALDPVAQAAETTTHAGGAQVTIKIREDLGALGGTFTISGHGDLNFETGEGELFVDLAGLPATARHALPSGGLTMTELFADNALYVGSPLLAGKLPGGARWMKLDLNAVAQKLGLDPQALTGGQANPGQYLEYLKASGSVREAGSATLRGVKTTRYVGTVDLRKAAELLPSPSRAAARSAIAKLIAQTGTSTIPVEAWIDENHMIRRLQMTVPVVVQGQKLSVSIDEELFDFGPTPSVNPPSAGEVYEVRPGPITSSGSGTG